MAGGLTYGTAKTMISTVVENGISPDDPRVLSRTNEAIKAVLDEMVPVNGMLTANVVSSGTTLLLPKELENVIEVEVVGGASVNGQTDVTQGWYEIVNNFVYVDPNSAHDNPLVDQGLVPDPNDATILRRQYDYPGLTPNSTVRVTGAKRYIPITQDSDYLIVQNILALKLMIQAIYLGENNDYTGSDNLRQRCLSLLQAEVKKFQLDPINSLKRKGGYEADMVNHSHSTFGWTRARLSFELPGGLNVGKSELTRILEQAEMRIMDKIQAIGTIQEYEATVMGGMILCPKEVQSIVDVSFCGQPLNIKSIYARYIQQGRWWTSCPCLPELRDEGEIRDVQGDLRRQYSLAGGGTTNHTLRFIAVLRWVKKAPTEYLTVTNFEAIRLMCQSILHQKNEKYQEAMVDENLSIQEVDKELGKYLAGQLVIPSMNLGIFSSRRRHGIL